MGARQLQFGTEQKTSSEAMRRFAYTLTAIFLMLVLCSCRTSRNTDTSINTEQKEALSRMQASIDSLTGRVSIFQSETMERMSNMKVENKTIYYSKPDSTGKQYTTAVSETRSESNEQESRQTDTELQASVATLSMKVDSLSYKLDAALSKKEKIVELSWWDKHKDKVYISVVLVIIGWLVIRSRFK